MAIIIPKFTCLKFVAKKFVTLSVNSFNWFPFEFRWSNFFFWLGWFAVIDKTGWHAVKPINQSPYLSLSLSLYIYIYICVCVCGTPFIYTNSYSVGCGSSICRLNLCRGIKTLLYNKYNTKQSNGEASAVQLREMWSTPLMPLLLGPLTPGVVVHIRVPCMVTFLHVKVFMQSNELCLA